MSSRSELMFFVFCVMGVVLFTALFTAFPWAGDLEEEGAGETDS